MAHSLVLFAERNVALEVFGASMTASQSQFFNPFFIIVLAPIFALLWRALSKSGFDPSTGKFRNYVCIRDTCRFDRY